MTEELFRDDSYLKTCDATVESIDGNALILDKTVFYPNGGGQPGDTGRLINADGSKVIVLDTQKGETGIRHIVQDDAPLPNIGDKVTAEIDWERRYRLMRMHTCMHLLCSIIPLGVTGGSIRDGSARLDFDAPEPMDKEQINTDLNRVIKENHPVNTSWISDEEMDAQAELVRTMSVQPPRGTGRVRLVNVTDVDLQPCGGTHVQSTGEIGPVLVKKIEKKGKHNRRVNIIFAE